MSQGPQLNSILNGIKKVRWVDPTNQTKIANKKSIFTNNYWIVINNHHNKIYWKGFQKSKKTNKRFNQESIKAKKKNFN